MKWAQLLLCESQSQFLSFQFHKQLLGNTISKSLFKSILLLRSKCKKGPSQENKKNASSTQMKIYQLSVVMYSCDVLGVTGTFTRDQTEMLENLCVVNTWTLKVWPQQNHGVGKMVFGRSVCLYTRSKYFDLNNCGNKL